GFPTADRSHRCHGGMADRTLGRWSADGIGLFHIRRRELALLENRAMVLIEHLEGEPVEPLPKPVVGAVIDNNRIDRKLATEINFPPRVLRVLLAMRLAASAPV